MKPATHRNDPPAAHAAEAFVNQGPRQAQQIRVYDLVQRNPGCTARELAEIDGGLDRYQVQRRLSDLFPEYLTRGPKRECNAGGRPASVWYAR